MKYGHDHWRTRPNCSLTLVALRDVQLQVDELARNSAQFLIPPSALRGDEPIPRLADLRLCARQVTASFLPAKDSGQRLQLCFDLVKRGVNARVN